MMKHTYTLTMQDFLAYHFNFIQTSPVLKRALFIKRYFYPVIFLGLPTLITPLIQMPYGYVLAFFALIAVLWVVFYNKVFTKSIVKKTHKFITSDKAKGILGIHEVQVGEKQLSEKTDSGVNVYHQIEHINETEEHLFIYVSTVMAIIIPKNSFESEENQSAFMASLNRFRGIES